MTPLILFLLVNAYLPKPDMIPRVARSTTRDTMPPPFNSALAFGIERYMFTRSHAEGGGKTYHRQGKEFVARRFRVSL